MYKEIDFFVKSVFYIKFCNTAIRTNKMYYVNSKDFISRFHNLSLTFLIPLKIYLALMII